ncbi:hypothetical protein V8B97DRAFT_606537 [Scleroderma yunnanense]
MELSELSSQRPTVQSKSILVDAHGNACKINVQAVELEGRPRLVRMLKNAGALVVCNIQDADFILVDPSTESGRRLIRMWGMDPTKVVLQQAWARLSIQAGHPLLQTDEWGGMRAIDDGLPVTIDGIAVDEEQEVEDMVDNPLPTPRITPDDPSIQNREVTESLTLPLTSGTGPMTSVTTHPQSMVASPDLHATVAPPLPSQYQFSQLSFPAQHGQPIPSMPPELQFHSQTTSANASLEVFSMFMTMLDVMRHNGPSQSQLSPSHQAVSVSQSHSDMPQSTLLTQPQLKTAEPLSNGGNTLRPSHRYQSQEIADLVGSDGFKATPHPRNDSLDMTDTRPSPSRKPHLRSPTRRLSTEVLSPSVSRKRPPAVKPTRPPKRANKGKRKEAIPLDSDEAESHSDTPPATAFSPTHTPYSASPPEPARIVIGQRNPGEIFMSGGGQPLHFFVQVDLHRRHNVVSNIKKNKGKIVNNIPDADYVIASSRAKSYEWLLKEATTLRKVPIQATFVIDCIEECALLDEIGYALEVDHKISPSRRGRQVMEKQNDKPKTTTPRPMILATKKKTPKNSFLPTNTQNQDPGHTPPVNSRLTSPSPPPPVTRQRMPGGKYYFTEEEDKYLCRYAEYHFNQDPSMPNTTLMQKLHAKMPHHPIASWYNNADRKFRSKLEDIRKRASIAKRKNTTDKFRSNSVGGTCDDPQVFEPGPSNTSPVDASSATPDRGGEQLPTFPAVEDLEKEDFDIICQFFASGGGDDDDDERVWQELAKFKPCRTAKSWPEYYAAHQEAVYARIEELMIDPTWIPPSKSP